MVLGGFFLLVLGTVYCFPHWGYLGEMSLVRGCNSLDEAAVLRSHSIYIII